MSDCATNPELNVNLLSAEKLLFVRPCINPVSEKFLPAAMTLYRYHYIKRSIYLVMCLTLLVPLICKWNEDLWMALNVVRTEHVESASYVFVVAEDGKEGLCPITHSNNSIKFDHLSLIWNWDSKIYKFYVNQYNTPEGQLIYSQTGKYIVNNCLKGLSNKEAKTSKLKFGPANVKVPFSNIPTLFVQEVLSPFNMFQVFSVCLWFEDGYWKYAVVILVSMLLEVMMEVKDIYQSTNRIREMVEKKTTVTVTRDGEHVTVDSDELVPGDIVRIETKNKIPADILVTNGKCVVSEAMLTGESVPLIKEMITSNDPKVSETKNVIFYGSEVLFTESAEYNYAEGLVLTTNYLTVRGGLVRSILYPTELFSDIQKDSYKWVLMMFFLAISGFLGTLPSLIMLHTDAYELTDKALDLITVVVPPALPLALSIGISHSLTRLRESEFKIYCTSPQKIIQAGLTDTIVFDKTGTLTEDKLLIERVMPFKFESNRNEDIAIDYDPHYALFRGMAVCQSLVLLDGQVYGDPLEIELLKYTDFEICDDKYSDNLFLSKISREDNMIERTTIDESPNTDKMFSNYQPRYSVNGKELNKTDIIYKDDKDLVAKFEYVKDSRPASSLNALYLLKKYDFDSNLARMSVVAKDNISPYTYRVYCKGSPESIMNLCNTDSLPGDYTKIVNQKAKEGLRIIAMAYKNVEFKNYQSVIRYSRSRAESDLIFCGFVFFSNRLKTSTIETLSKLQHANIVSYMATGDHIQTAIAVGNNCGFIPTKNKHNVGIIKPTEDSIEVVYEQKTLNLRNLQELYRNIEMHDERMLMFNNCGIKDTFAMEGDTLKHLLYLHEDKSIDTKLFVQILKDCRIYARMAPDLKKTLVQSLREQFNITVGMCGDGANDCAALKEANVGLSLSDAEASIAAPFTTSVFEIQPFIRLLAEGRCALVTSFQCFKWMAMYSLVQFITVSMLYVLNTNLSDNQFLWIDLFTILPLVYFMAWSKANDNLSPSKPPKRLISYEIISSVMLQMLIALAFQILAYLLITRDPNYVPIDKLMEERQRLNPNMDDESLEDIRNVSYETTAVFLVANFQYVITNMIYSAGYPYKEQFYKNFWLVFWLLFLTIVNVFMTAYDFPWFYESLMNLMDISYEFRLYTGVLVVLYAFCSWWAEKILIPTTVSWIKGR